MTNLNEPQIRAVTHPAGPLLVFAGAGSGKTRVITYRIASLLAEQQIPPYRILAVTFTNKAAGEMRARLEALAGPELARDLWVGTFHAICARLLRRYHAEVGLGRDYVIYDDSDQKAVIGRVLRDRGLSDREYPPKLVLAKIQRQKREGIGPLDVRAHSGFDDEMVELYARYQQALRTANAVDFEDLIVHVLRIAENPDSAAGKELRSRFRHVLVDEFQDTNAVQYRLVRALAAQTRNLCVVGDDDQSIYSWRGADVRNIRGFRHDFSDALVVKLEQNYRSTGNIVAAALGVIEPSPVREPKSLFTGREGGEPVLVRALRDEREEAAFVVDTIRKEKHRGVSPREIAVFYRVHAQSRVLEEALRAAGIAYQIVGGMKFFERAEVKDLLGYLRLVDNPRSDADLLRVINVPARGIGPKTVDRLLHTAKERETSLYDALGPTIEEGGLKLAARAKLEAFRELMGELRQEAKSTTPAELAERALELSGYRQVLREEDTAESDARLENLAELVGSIREYEEHALQTGQEAGLGGYLERVSLISDVDTMQDTECVTLMTVHSAKGLEFEAVLLTGMEEETFPYRGLESGSVEELEEERRLAYVAVTRARERLFMTHAAVRTIFGQTRYLAPSRFLADLPESAVKREGNPWGFSVDPYARGGPYGGAARRADAPTAQRRLQPGERTVEYDTFDDFADSAEAAVAVRPGDTVYHRQFGRGVVRSVQQGSSPTVVAHFPGFGQRKVRADYLTEDA